MDGPHKRMSLRRSNLLLNWRLETGDCSVLQASPAFDKHSRPSKRTHPPRRNVKAAVDLYSMIQPRLQFVMKSHPCFRSARIAKSPLNNIRFSFSKIRNTE